MLLNLFPDHIWSEDVHGIPYLLIAKLNEIIDIRGLNRGKKIKGMIPGFSAIGSKIPEDMLENQEAKISKWEHIIKSMTPEEKLNPEPLEKQTQRISRHNNPSILAFSCYFKETAI